MERDALRSASKNLIGRDTIAAFSFQKETGGMLTCVGLVRCNMLMLDVNSAVHIPHAYVYVYTQSHVEAL